jgi:tetratricopeptide (TPR) repeat protein
MNLARQVAAYFRSYSAAREIVLFAIALAGFGLSLVIYFQGRNAERVRLRIETEQRLDRAADLLGSTVPDLLRVGRDDLEKVKEADRLIRDALIGDSKNERALQMRVMLRIAQDDRALALNAHERLRQNTDSEVLIFTSEGMLAQSIGDLALAEEKFRAAYQVNMASTTAKINLAGVIWDQGRLSDAMPFLAELGRSHPRDCGAATNLGLIHRDLKDNRVALQYLQRAIVLCNESQTAYMNLGHVLTGEWRLDEALEMYLKAIDANPKYPGAHASAAGVYLHKGDIDQARRFIDQALKLDPHQGNARITLGMIELRVGNNELALVEFERAVTDAKDYPQDGSLHVPALNQGISAAYYELKKYDQALVHADYVLALDPTDLFAMEVKFASFQALGRASEAAAAKSLFESQKAAGNVKGPYQNPTQNVEMIDMRTLSDLSKRQEYD